MAPLVVILGFLGGAGFSTYVLPTLTTAAKVETVATTVYADIPRICPAADRLVDVLITRFPKSKTLARLMAADAAACSAAQRPDNIVNQIRLIVDVVQAIKDANKKLAIPAK